MSNLRGQLLLRRRGTKGNQGFTLIEVLVTLVIGGILAAIALPSFMNQAMKAKQIEAKLFIGTLNRAQQAHMLEYLRFTSDMRRLGVTIRHSQNYTYVTSADPSEQLYAIQHAESLHPQLNPIVGMVALHSNGGNFGVSTILCQAQNPTMGRAPDPTYDPTYDPTVLSCPTGTDNMN
jgi:prepilin-type N-terminal cleavage/methylation domain-containing protein